jgi:hypothetical protein
MMPSNGTAARLARNRGFLIENQAGNSWPHRDPKMAF